MNFCYRPLYLPIRTVLTLGNFSVSSNLIPETNTSYLRFLAQECNLFLSKLNGTKLNIAVPQDDDKTPDLNKDYVCVIDVGLFELSLRMEDKTNSVSLPFFFFFSDINHINSFFFFSVLRMWILYYPIEWLYLKLAFIWGFARTYILSSLLYMTYSKCERLLD